jgi:hypothetical protein
VSELVVEGWMLQVVAELAVGIVPTGHYLERAVELSSSVCRSPSTVAEIAEQLVVALAEVQETQSSGVANEGPHEQDVDHALFLGPLSRTN